MDEATYIAVALYAHYGADAASTLTDAISSMAAAGHPEAAVLWYDVLIEVLRLLGS